MPVIHNLLICIALLLFLSNCGHVTADLSMDEQPLPAQFELVEITAENTHRWYQPETELMGIARHDEFYDYVVGAGDVITLTLYVLDTEGDETLRRIIPAGASLQSENEFLVSAAGTVTIPFAGTLPIAGKPFHQVRSEIEQAMREYFINPQLEVRITEFANGQVLVSGEVAEPQMMPLSHQPLYVLQAITRAGGALPTADLEHAKLERENGQVIPINLEQVIYEGNDALNRVLRNGDTLHLPRNHANRIFVMGEVVKPQTLRLHPKGASLAETLSDVSGVDLVTGDSSQIYVLRGYADPLQPEQQRYPIYHLDASNLSHLVFADQFLLAPRDIVYVGTQEITAWNRFITQLLPQAVSTLVNRTNYVE